VTMEPVDPIYHDPVLGVVFDLDGTLVLSPHDFDRMRREVIRIAERQGVVPGHLSIRQTIPTLLEEARHELERGGASEGVRYRFEAEAMRALDAIEMEALSTTTVRPGALELVGGLAARGYRLGVLTRSSATFAQEALRRTGLLPFVTLVRSRTDSGPAKPDPEALLLLLKALGVPPNRAVSVGDHLLDAECAARARVRFYAVLSEQPNALGTDVERFRAAGAAAVASDLTEIGRQLGLVGSSGAVSR
ncbi:MAG: HAD family hydrolase, partial [Thermoplasmata archaeon]